MAKIKRLADPSGIDWILDDLSSRLSPADYPDFETGRIAREGWVLAPINMVASLRSEKADPKALGVMPFVGMDDIEPDGLQIVRTRPFLEMKSAGNRFYSGDLLYGRLRPYLNKTAVASFDGACSGELLVFAPSAAIESRYLQYFMHSRAYVGWVSAATSGDRPRVSFETAAKFAIPLAPLPEQRRIIARIDALFAEIAEGEAALAAARQGLEIYRRALLKAAVTGELTADWREANKPAETGHDLLARLKISSPSTTRSNSNWSPPKHLPKIPSEWAWCGPTSASL